MIVIKNTGRASSLFIIICTALVCFAIFCAYQFGAFKINQNRISQAEHEQTYGKPRGSSLDYKEQQAAILKQKNERKIAQEKLKGEWLLSFDSALNSPDLLKFGDVVTELKLSSLKQEYQIQVLREVASKVVKKHDSDALIALASTEKSPFFRCEIHFRFGKKLLDDSLKSNELNSFETLVKAGCMKGHSNAKTELISYIATALEPRRAHLFNALKSSSELQASVVKKLFEQDKQKVIAEYLSRGLIDKNFAVGNTSLLVKSISQKKSLLSQKLVEMGAGSDDMTSNYRSPIMVAIKNDNLALVEQLAAKYPESLKDSNFVRKIFESISGDLEHNVTKILFDSNPDVLQMEYVNRYLLRSAVDAGDLTQTKYLLEKGLSPNVVVGQKTILTFAIEKSLPNSKEIVGLLRKHSAVENVLDVVRLERGISIDTECKYDQTATLDADVFNEAYRVVNVNTNEDVSSWPEVKRCEAGIVYCKEQGSGVDECFASVPSCSSDSTGICCSDDLKSKYFEGRCAGLGVTETIMWMNVFSTVYGVPVNFR